MSDRVKPFSSREHLQQVRGYVKGTHLRCKSCTLHGSRVCTIDESRGPTLRLGTTDICSDDRPVSGF